MKHIILFIFISLVLINTNAQSVGIGTTTPNSSAMLDISSNNKGVLLPRLSDTSSVSSPAKGLVIFSNKNNKLWYFDGNHWQQAVSNAGNMDSIWYKSKDSIAFTPQEYVRINSPADLISPKANLEVTGSLLIQEKLIFSQTPPTAGQVYTMNNSGSTQTIPSADSVFRLYDPSGPNNPYIGTKQGDVFLGLPPNMDGLKVSSVGADFGLGTGDTLWISQYSYPSCRTYYFRRFTNTTTDPADFTLPFLARYFIFRSDSDGSNGKGFNFLVTRLYSNEPSESIRAVGSGLCYSSRANSFAVGYNAVASSGATALGYLAEASNSSFAAGSNSKATNSFSIALGNNAFAEGQYSSALGNASWAQADYSTGIAGGQASGVSSIALGTYSQAWGENSIAIGSDADATGDFSVCIGNGNASGSSSIVLGSGEASGTLSSTMGASTIARGYSSTSLGMYNNPILLSPATSSTPGQPVFIVGNGNSSGDRSNAMVVFKNGNIGLGTDFPDERLNVEGNITMNNPAGGTTMALYSAGVQKGFVQLSGDNLRLGTFSDNNAGTVIFRLNGADRFTINPNGNATLTGTLTQNSDAKFKDGIETIDNALNKVMQLNGYRYHWKPELKRDSSMQVGLIAQNVESVLPELVTTNKEGDKSVAYQNMVAVLIEAIKEQQKQIEAMQKKIDGLSNK